jgi:hypothetical protein
MLWTMARTRTSSTLTPAQPVDARFIVGSYRLLERARLLGLEDLPATVASPDDAARQTAAVAGRLAIAGLARAAAALAQREPGDAAAVERLVAALDANPVPEREWEPLRNLLGDELLGPLVGVSQSSLVRYAAGARATPDVVAARLHVLAMVCADLRGGYNDYGIRRWFVRPRPSLEGASIVDALGPDWEPDGPSAAKVRELAASVLSVGAT